MLKQLASSAAILGLLLAGAPAFAQDAVTLMTSESDEYGTYLTDGDGRAVYLFENDTQGMDDTEPQVACEGECLNNWPPLYTDGEPEAGDQVDSAMIGTIDHEGQTMVTYNGWPLYYFAQDEGSDEPTGQDIDNWYLVSPEGEQIESGE